MNALNWRPNNDRSAHSTTTTTAVGKNESFEFLARTEYPLSKSFINGIIIFEVKTTFLQDLHIVWYMILMFTNRLFDIKVSENETR